MSGHIRYTPQSGHSRRAAHSAARPEVPTPTSTPVRPPTRAPDALVAQRNVQPVLSLGATRYATIRGLGTFCCPPVPFKLGQLGMQLYVTMMNAQRQVIMTGDEQAQNEYFRTMRLMAKLLHRHIRPIGWLTRKLWAMRLTRNRFMQCSEQELKDVADFFLHGRMKSSVQFISGPEERRA